MHLCRNVTLAPPAVVGRSSFNYTHHLNSQEVPRTVGPTATRTDRSKSMCRVLKRNHKRVNRGTSM